MIHFTIDGREAEVEEGQTILEGARRLGIDIPTLCYLERCGPMTSCLACVVTVSQHGRTQIVPSCGMKAVEGMQVESETPAIHGLRRSALELLLSDHVGDCQSPCTRICPLALDIPVLLRHVQNERREEAVAVVHEALALPGVLSRLCHKPCEKGCRRVGCDSATAIRDVERYVADLPCRMTASCGRSRSVGGDWRVAVIGAGPTALAAAHALCRAGHACVVFHRGPKPGGTLRVEVSTGTLPDDVLDRDVRILADTGVEFRHGTELGGDLELVRVRTEFDAILVATGEASRSRAGEWGLVLQGPATPAGPAEAWTTNIPGVFCAGSVLRPIKQLVKAMAEGRMAAEAMTEFLEGRPARHSERPFSSLMGRLEASELALFLQGASSTPRCAAANGYSAEQASAEAARCLHCDCRAAGHCRLQHYSQVYGAQFGRFSRERRAFEQRRHPASVLFEPGKCILCGICVKIAEEATEPLGLSFVGRGFDVRVSAPLNEAFEQGLQKVAHECAASCPTGAIVMEVGRQRAAT
jgi:NADPH-dependent glutamate synthase beta subunit-like oxidoreductase